MTTEIEVSNGFEKATARPELGGRLGLTLHQIAKSLQAEFRSVKQKLETRGFLERLKAQGFQVIPTVMTNDSNGLEVGSYVLDLAAAKFFVGKYDSDIGDAYLAFLIGQEAEYQQVQSLSPLDTCRYLMATLETSNQRLLAAEAAEAEAVRSRGFINEGRAASACGKLGNAVKKNRKLESTVAELTETLIEVSNENAGLKADIYDDSDPIKVCDGVILWLLQTHAGASQEDKDKRASIHQGYATRLIARSLRMNKAIDKTSYGWGYQRCVWIAEFGPMPEVPTGLRAVAKATTTPGTPQQQDILNDIKKTLK